MIVPSSATLLVVGLKTSEISQKMSWARTAARAIVKVKMMAAARSETRLSHDFDDVLCGRDEGRLLWLLVLLLAASWDVLPDNTGKTFV